MFLPEKKLAIQVAEVYCVEIDNMNFTEACQDKVLEKFAANTASADEKDTRLEMR